VIIGVAVANTKRKERAICPKAQSKSSARVKSQKPRPLFFPAIDRPHLCPAALRCSDHKLMIEKLSTEMANHNYSKKGLRPFISRAEKRCRPPNWRSLRGNSALRTAN
jgi:hypothetical protein